MAWNYGKNVVEVSLVGTFDDKISANLSRVAREAQKVFKDIGAVGSGLVSSFKNLAIGGGVFGGALALISKSAIESEDAITRLNAGLRSSGQYTDETSASLQKFADELQKTTRYDDETTKSVMGMMASFGMTEEQIKRATKASIGLSAAIGVDLNAAALLMAKAFQGNTATLSRYGIQIEEGLDDTEKFEAVLSKLEGKKFFDIALADATTFGGALAGMRNAFSELAETVGGEFAPILADATRQLREFAQSDEAMKMARELGQALKGIIETLIDYVPKVIEAVKAIANFAKEHKTLVMVLAGGVVFKDTALAVAQLVTHLGLLETAAIAGAAAIAKMTWEAIKLGQDTENLKDSMAALEIQQARIDANMMDRFGQTAVQYEATVKWFDNLIAKTKDIANEEERQEFLLEKIEGAMPILIRQTGDLDSAWETVGLHMSRHNIDIDSLNRGTIDVGLSLGIANKNAVALGQSMKAISEEATKFAEGFRKSMATAFSGLADPSNYDAFLLSFGHALSSTVREQIIQALAEAAFSKEMMAPIFNQIEIVGAQIREGLTPDFTGLQTAMSDVAMQYQAYIPLVQTVLQDYANLDTILQHTMGTTWELVSSKESEKTATDSMVVSAVEGAQALADHAGACRTDAAAIDNTIRAYTTHDGVLYELTGSAIRAGDGLDGMTDGLRRTGGDLDDMGDGLRRAGSTIDEFAEAARQGKEMMATVWGSTTIYSKHSKEDIFKEISDMGTLQEQWGRMVLEGKSVDDVAELIKSEYDLLARSIPNTIFGQSQKFNLQQEYLGLIQLLQQLSAAMGAAEGISFTVGGRAGRDANLVPLWLTRGEKVTVTPPDTASSLQSAASGINITLNIASGAKVDRQSIRDELLPEIVKALKRQHGTSLLARA